MARTKSRPAAAVGAGRDASRRARPRPGRSRLRAALVASAAALLLFGGLLYALRPAPSATPPSTAGLRPIAVLDTPDMHSLLFSRSEPGVVYFGHHGGLLRSEDGGATWSPVPGVSGDAMQLTGPIQAPELAYLTGHDVLLVSRDGGDSWQPLEHDLPGTDIHGFAVDPADPHHLFAFVVGFGLYESRDGGARWTALSQAVPGDTMAVAYLPGEPEALFVGTLRQGIARSTDGGQTWQGVGRAVGAGIMALATHRADPDTLYAGGQGLFVSRSRGDTWERLGPFQSMIMAISIDPHHPETLLVVDEHGRVYRSRDGGQTWGG